MIRHITATILPLMEPSLLSSPAKSLILLAAIFNSVTLYPCCLHQHSVLHQIQIMERLRATSDQSLVAGTEPLSKMDFTCRKQPPTSPPRIRSQPTFYALQIAPSAQLMKLLYAIVSSWLPLFGLFVRHRRPDIGASRHTAFLQRPRNGFRYALFTADAWLASLTMARHRQVHPNPRPCNDARRGAARDARRHQLRAPRAPGLAAADRQRAARVEGAAGALRAAQGPPAVEGLAAHGAGAGAGRGLCGAAEGGGRGRGEGELVHVGGANCSEPLINGSLSSSGDRGQRHPGVSAAVPAARARRRRVHPADGGALGLEAAARSGARTSQRVCCLPSVTHFTKRACTCPKLRACSAARARAD